jgi:DNA-binding response OmpR family regulator
MGMSVRPRILIADNDATNVQLLSDICATEDLEVLVAGDGDETLKCIEEDPPDLVLLDVMMPQRDGFQVLEELRSRPATRLLPVILVTAVSDDDSIRQGYQAGANDYITKPFKVIELVSRMKTLLNAAAYERISQGQARWEVGDIRALREVLAAQLAREDLLPVALLLLQLMQLESVDQDHDRATTTRVLHKATARLRAHVRGVDSAYVLPPNLVAFVLVNTDLPGAESVGRRLLQHLRPVRLDELEFPLEGRSAITVANAGVQISASELIQRCINQLGR